VDPKVARAQDGALELFTAETLFEGGVHVTEKAIYRHFEDLYEGSERVSNPEDQARSEFLFVTGADYGLREDLTLSVLVPVVYTVTEERDATGWSRQHVAGLGDVFLAVKHRFVRELWTRSAFTVAGVLGLELPTGATNVRDDGERIAPARQPGSGSWDPVAALALTLSVDRFRLDALVRYKLNTEGAHDLDNSDVLTAAIRGKYRFLHMRYPGPTAAFELGLRYRYETDAFQDGDKLSDFGGDRLVGRVALTSHPTPGTDLNLSCDLPLYQTYRGTQLGLKLSVALGFGLRF
jgi:hypothetical protein